jgi:hypothetical protein
LAHTGKNNRIPFSFKVLLISIQPMPGWQTRPGGVRVKYIKCWVYKEISSVLAALAVDLTEKKVRTHEILRYETQT